ncbi:MAG: hypothetical protein EA412_05515 [Chitinophagaceae bacterium]|nr:MAG: hypothetical protein EA412_05515 [Chitinophagaceae bacterium]
MLKPAYEFNKVGYYFVKIMNIKSVNHLKIIFLGIIGFMLILPSCSPYEEGPALSLRTKKNRITNTWQIDSLFINEIYRPELKDSFTLDIEREGEFLWTESGIYMPGMWAFDQNNGLILVFKTDNLINQTKYWEIMRLARTEFWIEEVKPDYFTRIQFVPLEN